MLFVVVPDRDRFLFLFSVGMCQSIEHIRPNITTVTTFLEFRFVCITKTVLQRMFKKIEGITPQKYLENLSKGSDDF